MSATGPVVACLAEALADTDVIHVAADSQRATMVAEALAVAAPEATVVLFPESDALPGDSAPASAANTGRRVAALHALAQRRGRVALVTTAEAAARRYPPPAAFDRAPPELGVGDAAAVEDLADLLRGIGYADDERVDEPGTVAVRGQTVDVFPADAALPVRIEVDEGRIAAIRAFDPLTQLGTATLDRRAVGRIDEPPLGDTPVTLFDHLPDAAVLLDPDAPARRDRFLALVADISRGAPPRDVLDSAQWDAAFAGRAVVEVAPAEPMPRFAERRDPRRAVIRAAAAAIEDGARIIVVGAPRDVRFVAARLAGALKVAPEPREGWVAARDAAPRTLGTLAMVVDRGWTADGVFVLAAADVLGGRALLDAAAPAAAALVTAPLAVDDVVVHEAFGLARVAGIEPLPGDEAGDVIVLEHAGGARRLVSAADADLIWRYGGEADAVTLDTLDGASWTTRRAALDAALADTAAALTALAAERATRTCAVIDPDASAYERFAAGFPWTETADQARAIAALRADLASGRPVDRLVIGDVGYGKTEVALRAAALAALAGRQVAVAAPTTVLVRQHLEQFTKRFAGTGITVAGLSRRSSPGERKKVIAGLADGSVEVVVGTAAIAGKGVAYRDLALVVIDEEQRFGAADKARLAALSDTAHRLTLTATPIPRTLQSALVGLQALSVIATPPARRQPIRTVTGAFDPARVRAALLREKARGGQSFVVVPRIDDMAGMRDTLGKLVPELTVREAHGKMPVDAIDTAMVDFANGDGDILLATNIIEAGLDVPRANTMIVVRADRFGLAQLHQLRGRVGRGARRGQVLLLTDADTPIAERTLRRLRTLETFDRLGAGFDISARDLDVRGAGDLLGEAQAGHVRLIGVDLYQHLLEGALAAARGQAIERVRCDLNLGLAGRFPAEWVPDVDVRLELYARLARLDPAAIDAFEDELDDRFGALPDDAATLLAVARLRRVAEAAGIARIDAGPGGIALTLRPDATAPDGLVEKDGRYILAEKIADPTARLARLALLLGGDD